MQVAGISYDSPQTLKRFAEKSGIEFLLLSDRDSKTIDAYGVRDRSAAGSRLDGIPHPVTIIVDEKGVIRKRLGQQGYRARHGVAELIQAGKDLR